MIEWLKKDVRMKKKYLVSGIGMLILMGHGVAVADNLPGSVTVTLADAYYHFDNKRDLDNSAFPNLAVAYNFTPHWAMEAGAGVLNTTQSKESGGRGVHGVLYNIDGIYRFISCGHFEPYILGGIGLLTLVPNGTDSEHPGNVNIGLGAQLFFGPTVAMRAEFRDVYQTTGNSHNDYMVNFGVSFLFGGEKNIVKNYK